MLTERTAQELASIGRLAGGSAERTLHEIAGIATRSVSGCAAAAVAVWNESRLEEAAVSHPDIGKLLDAQRFWNEGPILRAREILRPVFVNDTLRERRWPRYAPAAVRCGVRSSLVLPLHVDDMTVTFALHGARPGAWDERVVLPMTSLLAAQLGVVLSNVAEYEHASRATRR